jgi:NTE family protein
MDLVLEGGGVRGIGLVGAITALDAAGYGVGTAGRVAGTSAGAIAGSLLAAGVPAKELAQIVRMVDYRRFRDSSRFGALGDAVSLLTRLGLYRGDRLHRWIERQLAARGVRTFGDLRINDPDSALPPERSFRLVVVVSDITRGRMLRLPWDYPYYGLNPDEQSVADAVRASASIPFFFRPVKLADTRGGTPSRCVDGGVLSNFPIELFDRDDGRRPRWPTFGVLLSARSPRAVSPDGDLPTRGPLGVAKTLINRMIAAQDRVQLTDPAVRDRTILVDAMNVNAADFDLGPSVRDELYANGRRAAERFLGGWDFETYRRTYPTGQTRTPDQGDDQPAPKQVKDARGWISEAAARALAGSAPAAIAR